MSTDQPLRITERRLGDRAGVIGAASMVLDEVLSLAAADGMLSNQESAESLDQAVHP